MENGLAFEPRAIADIDHLLIGAQQARGGGANALAAEPRRRRQMRVFSEKIAEFGLADAAGFRQRRSIREILRRGANAALQAFEQCDIFILALVEEIGAAAFAGAQAGGFRIVFRCEDADVLRLGLACGAARQAIDPRRQNADDEFAVVFSGAGRFAVPCVGLR